VHAEHGHVKALVTEFFGNYTLQDLLGATQALRLAAARLKAEGKTSMDALNKLVGMRDGSDALGAPILTASSYSMSGTRNGSSWSSAACTPLGSTEKDDLPACQPSLWISRITQLLQGAAA